MPITIPAGVEYQLDGNVVIVKGKKGELRQEVDLSGISLKLEENVLSVSRASDAPDHRSKHGLYRALIQNMVVGVSEGFVKEMEVVGVGYRANASGQMLELAIGFSHQIVFEIPQEVRCTTISEKGKAPVIKLESHDKQLLGAVAAKIRSLRKPEPYKGKGIKFVDEVLRRKAGKSAGKK